MSQFDLGLPSQLVITMLLYSYACILPSYLIINWVQLPTSYRGAGKLWRCAYHWSLIAHTDMWVYEFIKHIGSIMCNPYKSLPWYICGVIMQTPPCFSHVCTKHVPRFLSCTFTVLVSDSLHFDCAFTIRWTFIMQVDTEGFAAASCCWILFIRLIKYLFIC